MRWRILVLTLSVVVFAEMARADAHAPVTSTGGCLSADVGALRTDDSGAVLYRIVFLNHCEAPRNFFWCAEHPYAQLPATIACRAQGGLGADPRHAIRHRKEFQWHLPPGARIRFQDCPSQEAPTADFGCAPLATSATRR